MVILAKQPTQIFGDEVVLKTRALANELSDRSRSRLVDWREGEFVVFNYEQSNSSGFKAKG